MILGLLIVLGKHAQAETPPRSLVFVFVDIITGAGGGISIFITKRFALFEEDLHVYNS